MKIRLSYRKKYNNEKLFIASFGKPIAKKRDLKHICKYYSTNKDKADSIDEKTWDDLEMDRLFDYLDRTTSKTGEQFFYNYLRKEHHNNDQLRLKEKVAFYENNFAKLHANAKLLAKYNNNCSYNLPGLLKSNQEPTIPNWSIYFSFLSFLLFSLVLVHKSFLLPFVGIGILNTFFHYYFKRNINIYFYDFQNIKNLKKYYYSLIQHDNESDFLTKNEKIILKKITNKCTFLSLNIDVADEFSAFLFYIIEIIKGVFLLDALQFNSLIKLIKNHSTILLRIFELIGIIDSSISVVSIKKNTNGCEPIFMSERKIKIINAYNPLIKECVKNSIELDINNAIITGGNMSGKTTFLKTLALNIHLSNKIGYALCDSIEIPKFKIITSINNEDNLEEGLSYFMDELLRIKRIIDQTNSTDDLLLIAIDEIFRGTNSKDRITLASSVLNYLSGKNCLVIVTTHDLDIVKFVKENYSPYFFNNSFVNNEVIFDYVIQKGIQYETNVIDLVRSLSFPPEIIKSALDFEKRIKHAHNSKS